MADSEEVVALREQLTLREIERVEARRGADEAWRRARLLDLSALDRALAERDAWRTQCENEARALGAALAREQEAIALLTELVDLSLKDFYDWDGLIELTDRVSAFLASRSTTGQET